MEETRGLVVKDFQNPTVAVDFDRTLVDDEGRLISGAKEAVNHLKQTGWKVIIWTARNDVDEVVRFLEENGIAFDYFNENPDADSKDSSRKIAFDATVDDKAVPFDGDWTKAVAELERRREAWKLETNRRAPVKLMSMDEEGEPRTVALFEMRDGRVVEKLGGCLGRRVMVEGVETEDRIVYPREGEQFLKALEELNGSYLWAEV